MFKSVRNIPLEYFFDLVEIKDLLFLNLFQPNVPFLYPLKTLEKLWF